MILSQHLIILVNFFLTGVQGVEDNTWDPSPFPFFVCTDLGGWLYDSEAEHILSMGKGQSPGSLLSTTKQTKPKYQCPDI